ncbi:MAG: amidohydrolase family protein [Schaedlerella sp.]|nr:amidohydrolase family protein [Lachnospiraceae bacterium]MDY4203253.1 amidohydrolase family protein [Schaedlerella sp.]
MKINYFDLNIIEEIEMIDFHTHLFPDRIAEKTMKLLRKQCRMDTYTDGTAACLSQSTEKAGLELSVILPVVMKPAQFQSVNEFAVQFRGGNLLSFGGIHPDSNDYKGELRQLKDMGFKGIKLHPDDQNTMFNDIRYKRIISYASELDFIISVHAGYDPRYPDCTHCVPSRAREVINEVKPPKMILAHMGGFRYWDEVEKELVGLDVFLDTAVVFGTIPDEQFIRICRNHGTDRILFASDSPWLDQEMSVKYLMRLDLTDEEKDLIFTKNAQKLLTLK